jgi:hypothetical protein
MRLGLAQSGILGADETCKSRDLLAESSTIVFDLLLNVNVFLVHKCVA